MSLIELRIFECKLIQLKESLYKYGFFLTSNRAEADDLLQDTMLKAIENQEKFSGEENLSGWLHTIMRNIFINNYRRKQRNQIFINQTEELYQLHPPRNSGIETPEGNYTLQEITRAINMCEDEHRLPFSMYITGYKYNEIAEKLDLPLGTVKSRIHATRQRLQVILRDYR